MKKLLLLFAITFMLLTSAQAQFFLGGSMTAYKYPGDHGVKFTRTSFSPFLGYQHNRWSFGLGFSYIKATGIYHSLTYGRAHALTYEPFVRYDIVQKSRFAFFTDAFFSYTRYDGKNLHYLGFSPGIRYDLSKHLIATVQLGAIGYSDDFFYGYKGLVCSLSLNTALISLYYRFAK